MQFYFFGGVTQSARYSEPPSLPYFKSSWTKCLKNQPYAVIKIKEMRGEVEKKHKKKRWTSQG